MGLKQNGTPSQLPWAGHVKVRKAGRARSGNDPYAKAIRWFYAPVSKRPLSPFRDYTLEDYLHAATEHSSPASRREAARVSP